MQGCESCPFPRSILSQIFPFRNVFSLLEVYIIVGSVLVL